MKPRAFLIRSWVPASSLSRDAEDLGLYAAASARSWSRSPQLVRLDGLTSAQLRAARDKARLLDIQVADAMPYRHQEDWSEGLLLLADTASLDTLARNLTLAQPSVGEALSAMLGAISQRKRRLRLKSGELALGGEAGAILMGILNVTPDSFSDGGRFSDPDAGVAHALAMAAAGARVIDVGGESSRPGSRPVEAAEEMRRTLPVIERLRAVLPPGVHVSIDTMKAEVARRAVEAGAEIINDVSGLSADPQMRAAAALLGVPVVINHMKGTPGTMQQAPSYRHVIPEIVADLYALVDAALQAGVAGDKIIIDPGIGFGKRGSHNLAILRHIPAFVSLGRPVMVGLSRKSFLADLAPAPEASSSRDHGGDARADATLASETVALMSGAHILRTHDVQRAARALKLAEAVSMQAASSESPALPAAPD